MSSNLVRKTVCLLAIVAMVLSTLLVFPTGISSRANEGEIYGIVAYETGTGIPQAVPGASVKLYNLHTGEMTFIETNAQGTFSFPNLKPGHYQVFANPSNSDYLTKENPNGSMSGIIEIGKATQKDLELYLMKVPSQPQPTYTVDGFVFDEFNNTIPNATVTLISIEYPGYEVSIQTNESGGYSLSSFRGMYELWTTAEDYQYTINNTFNLNQLKMSNYNVTLIPNETAISGFIGFNNGKPDQISLDVFLFDTDTGEIYPYNFNSTLYYIKTYHGNFNLILDHPGYEPYYHSEVITLDTNKNTINIPKHSFQATNEEKIVSTISFINNNWNNIRINELWTLNHDTELFGLEYVDYGDPVTIGCPRFQIDMEPGFNSPNDQDGIVNGNVNGSENNLFKAWLKERGPYHMFTDGYFEIQNISEKEYTGFDWKDSTFSITPNGFTGNFDSMMDMTITSSLDYTNKGVTLDDDKYHIKFRNLRESEVIVFNIPAGFEISNPNSYDTEKVWVKAFNKCQINDTVTITVEALDEPTAVIQAFDTKNEEFGDFARKPYVDVLENITLNGSISSPGSGVIEKYTWDFDDGKMDTGMEVTRNYTKAGIYNITLTVLTTAGLTDFDWIVFSVDDTAPKGRIVFQNATNKTGVVIDEGDEDTPEEDFEIYFNASKSTDTLDGETPGEIRSYRWTFGDISGISKEGEVVVYSYDQPGTYEVILNLTDYAGHYSLTKRDIKINDIEPPVPSMKTDPQNRICDVDKWIELNATTTTDNSMPGATWEEIQKNLTFKWDFDITEDGPDADDFPENDVDAEGAIVNFTGFKRTGTYPIGLWVTDQSGNVINTSAEPIENWQIDVIGVDLRFSPVHEEINKYIETSKEDPKVGDKVTFTVNVTNANAMTAEDITVTLRVDGKVIKTKEIESMEEDHWEVLKFTWTAKGKDVHNISFNVSLGNENYEQFWINNDQKIDLEVTDDPWIDTPCLVAIIVVIIIVVFVIAYFYRRRREEAEFGKRREKGKGKGKGKGAGKSKDRDKEKGKSKDKKKSKSKKEKD